MIDENIDSYLRDISIYNKLTKQEEREIFDILNQKNQSIEIADLAREKLIHSNLRFVVYIACKYENKGLPLSDLIQEGNFGLIKAARSKGWCLDYGFSSWAFFHIRSAILRAITDKSRIVHIPIHRYEQLSKEERSKQQRVEIDNLQRKLEDDIPDAIEEEIAMLVTRLDEKESRIIIEHYGLLGEKPVSYIEIGKELGLSSERIRQIANKAIDKLKRNILV